MKPDAVSFTRVAFTASLGAFIIIGALDAAPGPLLRPISHVFGVSLPVAGTVISVEFAGALTGVLCVMAGLRRAPHLPLASVTVCTVAAGSVVITLARTWPVLLAGMFLAGAGFGGTDFSLNQLMSRTRPQGRAARLNILNAAFGAGAVLGPAVVGVLGAATLRWGFAAAAGISCALAAGLYRVRPAPRPGPEPGPGPDQDPAPGAAQDQVPPGPPRPPVGPLHRAVTPASRHRRS